MALTDVFNLQRSGILLAIPGTQACCQHCLREAFFFSPKSVRFLASVTSEAHAAL